MPTTAMDYSKCCIYKIEHFENDKLVYVGHTTNFIKRKIQHKCNCNNENGKPFNYKLYKMIRENGGWYSFKMIEVEKYPCKDKREAERRENEISKGLKACMNTNKICVSKDKNEYMKEYTKDNKDKLREQTKQYYETNKHKLREHNKEYRETNKHKIREYRKHHYETNKEKKQEYYKNNKHKLTEKITCKCGCEVSKNHLPRHERSKKHIDLMNM
jgi:hypothetical protein